MDRAQNGAPPIGQGPTPPLPIVPSRADALAPLTLAESLDEFTAQVEHGTAEFVLLEIVLDCCSVHPSWAQAFAARIRVLASLGAIAPALERALLLTTGAEGAVDE